MDSRGLGEMSCLRLFSICSEGDERIAVGWRGDAEPMRGSIGRE